MLKVRPEPYRRWPSFVTLVEKEILRFRKIALQTIAAPVLMGLLYMMVFGSVMSDQMKIDSSVSYQSFLIPGLVMMTLLQNAFGNSASSILGAKIMGSIVYVQLPPFSGLQLACSFIGASILRGLVCGFGVYAVCLFWSAPTVQSWTWVLCFAVMGAAFMGSLGVICGLWAEKFDQMGAFQTFFIMPLTFLSGVFYSVSQLPPIWAKLSMFNPFFYIIDGFRYGFFSQSDFNPFVSLTVLTLFCLTATGLATLLLVKGYKIRK